MRKFNIKVNGTAYEVEVEETGSVSQRVSRVRSSSRSQVAKPEAKVAEKTVYAPKTPAQSAGNTAGSTASNVQPGAAVHAPMPGTILEIKVGVGETVEKGQVLLILEAMKMENEITAPAAGVVGTIPVSKGTSVVTNDVLVTFA